MLFPLYDLSEKTLTVADAAMPLQPLMYRLL